MTDVDEWAVSQKMYAGAHYELRISREGDGLVIAANDEYEWTLDAAERERLIRFLMA